MTFMNFFTFILKTKQDNETEVTKLHAVHKIVGEKYKVVRIKSWEIFYDCCAQKYSCL
jgi:hypothetical protein